MTWLLSLPAKLKLWAVAIGTVFVAILAAYLRGRTDEAEAAYNEEMNEYVETRKRIDQADTPSDADAAREWLRNRSK